jgi:hypothetical protein
MIEKAYHELREPGQWRDIAEIGGRASRMRVEKRQ